MGDGRVESVVSQESGLGRVYSGCSQRYGDAAREVFCWQAWSVNILLSGDFDVPGVAESVSTTEGTTCTTSAWCKDPRQHLLMQVDDRLADYSNIVM